MADVRAALTEFLGVAEAAAFLPTEIEGLHQNGYVTAARLQVASEEGLKNAGLLSASVDAILSAQGEQRWWTSERGLVYMVAWLHDYIIVCCAPSKILLCAWVPCSSSPTVVLRLHYALLCHHVLTIPSLLRPSMCYHHHHRHRLSQSARCCARCDGDF